MAIRLAILACAVVSLTGSALPAEAGEHWHRDHGHWEATHEALYELEHDIALLEADPAVDDGYKAPVIAHEGAEVRRLQLHFPRRTGVGRLPAATAEGQFTFGEMPNPPRPTKGLVLRQRISLRRLSVGSRVVAVVAIPAERATTIR